MTKSIAIEKLEKIEAFNGFKGEQLTAKLVSTVYKGLAGIQNSTFLGNRIALDKWWTKKYFSYLGDKPQTSADINNIYFDTTLVS